MFQEDYDYFPEHQRNMHFEKPMHGPRGPPGPRGGPPGPHGGRPPGPHVGGPPAIRRRMMSDPNGPPPPNFRGPHEPPYENDFPQSRGMNMRNPQGNMSRGPPPHFGEFGSPRQSPPGMGKGHFQRPMIPPFGGIGVPPPGFSSGGPGAGPGGGGGSGSNPPHSAPSNNHSQNNSNANISNLDLTGELWVETKASNGKQYYYNARTRQTVWTRPENVNVLQQEQISALAAATGNSVDVNSNENKNTQSSHVNEIVSAPNQFQFVPMGAMPMGPMPAPGGMGMLPPVMGFGPPRPFGMPPPMVAMSPGYSPFGMAPPFPLRPAMSNAVCDTALLSKRESVSETPDGDSGKDPNIEGVWAEFKSPCGRVYYFNKLTSESTWEKPAALISAEDKVEENKINESEREGESTAGAEQERETTELENLNPEVIEVSSTVMDTEDSESKEVEEPKVESNNQMEIQENGSDNVEEKISSDNEVSSASKDEMDVTEKETPKIVDKTRPVSCTAIANTAWCVVWTGDNRAFFFNPSFRISYWERPAELIGRADVDKLLENPPPQKNSPVKEKPDKSESDSPPEAKKIKLEETEDDDVLKEKVKKVQEEPNINKNSITPGKEAAMEAELRAAKERANVHLEVRVQRFRDLLVQNNVSAFSTWEKELHKIVFQPEYLLLTSRERKQVFEKYVKERAEEERNEKRKKMRERKDDFKKLLDEACLTAKSTFSDFAQKYGKDDRFKMIEKMRERENMFNDYLQDLRRKERDERSCQRDKAKKDFIELLKENKFDKHSRWSDLKKGISDDSRYKAVDSSSLREEWFKEYIGKLSRDTEDDVSKEREKQERVEASIREREKEVQRTLSTHLRERDKERELHKHEEAIQHYKALLTDLVRSPDVTFHEVKKTLRKDHRYEAVVCLEREEREKVFEEHISFLYRKKKEKFRELLDETIEIALTSTWKEIKKLIKDDPRCSKFSSSDRKCEKEFKEYLKDKMVAAKADFRELLKETKIITYKSRKLIEDSDHLHDIEKVLQNDKRYLVLQCIEDERRELLMAYIDTLDRKGPPPPPTASEPSRRSTK